MTKSGRHYIIDLYRNPCSILAMSGRQKAVHSCPLLSLRPGSHVSTTAMLVQRRSFRHITVKSVSQATLGFLLTNRTPILSLCRFAVLERAAARREVNCAICLEPLQRQQRGCMAPVALLSCSHVFHESCVASFETFAAARQQQPVCPCCCAAFTRHHIHVTAV